MIFPIVKLSVEAIRGHKGILHNNKANRKEDGI